MSAFDRMRARLQAKGLIGSDYRLTNAGNAHARDLIVLLRSERAPCNPAAPRVYWNVDFRQRRRG